MIMLIYMRYNVAGSRTSLRATAAMQASVSLHEWVLLNRRDERYRGRRADAE